MNTAAAASSTAIRPVEILLVEDSPVDVMLTRETLLESRIINSVQVVGNGDDALAYLRRRPPFTSAIRPDLILLDLNIPRLSGHEVLAEIKADPLLRSIPVVVLTTSAAADDVKKAHDGHASCFLTKPADLESLVNAIKTVEQMWLCIVTTAPAASG